MKTPKGEYLAYHKRHAREERRRRAARAADRLLRDLSFPKQMHWDAKLDDGRGELLFGRPIRWLLFLYGGRVVPVHDRPAPRTRRDRWSRTSSPAR